VPFLFFAAIALIGAAAHVHRDSRPRSAGRTLEIFLVWWMVVAVGAAAIFGAMFHLFDGPSTAREIGYTNGDGGFQAEVGFADLAIGVLGVLCFRFRDGFLLAAVIAVSIAYLGDAYGHLHQEAIHDNHDPDNTGLLLWSDFITPLVAIGFYAAWRRATAPRRAETEPSPTR
jgi:Family of unknown function (DUF6790)